MTNSTLMEEEGRLARDAWRRTDEQKTSEAGAIGRAKIKSGIQSWI